MSEEEKNEIIRQLIECERNAAIWVTAKTQDEIKEYDKKVAELLRRIQTFSVEDRRQIEIQALTYLASDPEAPYFVKESSRRALENIEKTKKKSEEVIDKVLIERKRILAEELVKVIGPQIEKQIPEIIKESLVEVATQEQLEVAVKESEKGKIRVKKGCIHLDIGDISIVWSGPSIHQPGDAVV